jgi:ABC-type Fe3+/spermidine/putrescine transport system ATPase subunit
MSGVRLEGIAKKFGDFIAVQDVDLDIHEGEFVTFLGPSGSGKTTCLRIIAGFVEPSAGRIFIGTNDVTAVPPHRRATGMVFQQYALFPHLTVAENVAFGLKVRRLPRAEIRLRTQETIKLVRLEGLSERYPSQLSGGQKQRVALARAVVINPRVLLLDEPLGALDLKLREELQGEIKRVQSTLGITTISVTHDQGEALSMSDRVVVMREGRVLQMGPPSHLYHRPNSLYTATFVGKMNLFETTILSRRADGSSFVLQLDGAPDRCLRVVGHQEVDFAVGDRCLLAFRPEEGSLDASAGNTVPARVEKATYRGESWMVNCTTVGNRIVTIRLPAIAAVPPCGLEVQIGWSPERCILLRSGEEGAAQISRATAMA